MKKLRDKNVRRDIRKMRIKKKIHGTLERPRLILSKSLKFLQAQIIDDDNGKTLASCSTMKKELKTTLKSGKNIEAAKELGKIVGQIAKEKGILQVVFDRNGYFYHGKVKAFAEAVREKGINF
ncbi:MAG: 50S ribosomal protein L18 [Elusimicrobiota bacterium]